MAQKWLMGYLDSTWAGQVDTASRASQPACNARGSPDCPFLWI